MSILEQIKKFFGITKVDSYNYLDTTHLIIATIVTLLTIFLGVFLGLKNRNKDEKSKIKVIFPFAIIMWILLVIRLCMVVIRENLQGGNGWQQLVENDLPLFLCDIQYFALIAVCFAKGKLRKAGLDFVICLGILTLIMGVWLNAGTFSNNPWWCSSYIYQMIVHAIPGGISLYILVSKLESLRFKNIWITLLVFISFSAIALILDYSIDANYMFFVSDSGTPFFIFKNWAGDSLPLYSFFVLLGMLLYIIVFYLVFEIIFQIKRIKNS